LKGTVLVSVVFGDVDLGGGPVDDAVGGAVQHEALESIGSISFGRNLKAQILKTNYAKNSESNTLTILDFNLIKKSSKLYIKNLKT
jgi:hypothetical protein